MAREAGYSHRPLIAKLGIKPSQKIAVVGEPATFRQTLGRLPPRTKLVSRLGKDAPVILAFTKSSQHLAREFPAMEKRACEKWHAQASSVSTGLRIADARKTLPPGLGFRRQRFVRPNLRELVHSNITST